MPNKTSYVVAGHLGRQTHCPAFLKEGLVMMEFIVRLLLALIYGPMPPPSGGCRC